MKQPIKVLIDNGHGEETTGKRSPDGRLREYRYCRDIAQRVSRALSLRGVDALLLVPETSDTPLKERARKVNAWCSKLGSQNVVLISIHNNAAGADGKWKSAGGWCAYTSPGETNADKLASLLYSAAETALAGYISNFPKLKAAGVYDSKQRPVRTDYSDGDPDFEESFYILRKTNCPAVLTENLFQDNEADVAYLLSEEGKQAIATLHVEAIIDYINTL